MDKPNNDIGELQKIQFQIAKFIDKYRAESAEDVVADLKNLLLSSTMPNLALWIG